MPDRRRDTDARPVIVAGASGLLGPYLIDAARRAYPNNPVFGLSRHGPDLLADLLDFDRIGTLLTEQAPCLVVHAAALTNVDACEQQATLADALHRQSVANIAAALPADAGLVYISTDQVYADVPGPHPESPTAPVNVYGLSKLAGEQAALAHPAALVVRTNLFGPSRTPGRASLSDFMVDRFRSGEPIKLFSDALFSPLHMETLATLLFEMFERRLRGVYNLGCRNGASKMEFGYLLAGHLGLSTDHATEVRSADMPGRVPRTKDLRMDVTRLERALGYRLPTLLDEIHKL